MKRFVSISLITLMCLTGCEGQLKADNNNLTTTEPSSTPSESNPSDAAAPCSDATYRQFDFWLGDWDVRTLGASKVSGRNILTRAHDGCVMLENYTAGAFTGMSINFYDQVTKKWHQTWMSNQGGALYLEGGLNADGSMVLSDAHHETSRLNKAVNRVTWTPNSDGSVRQHWQQSKDAQKTWATVFDGIYTRRETAHSD